MTTLTVEPPLPIVGDARWKRVVRRFRVRVVYLARHGRLPDLDQPKRFTEWVQWRKLSCTDRSLDRLTDKLWSKERAGDLAVPRYWSGTELPTDPPGPLPLIVKANHGCGQFVAIHERSDWERARRMAPRWLAAHYGEWLDEPAYRAARRLVLVEPYLGGAGAALPEDYKVYVFGGRAAIVQHHRDRAHRHRWTQYDREWRHLGGETATSPRPDRLEEMLAAAERIGSGHDFLRVDFYDVGGRLWFGEFCLYPGSGLDPFTPDELDFQLGKLWGDARNAR